jgi:hypothetical protein
MKILTSVIMLATVASLVAGCAAARTAGSAAPSDMEQSDRLYCERHDGRWVAAAGVCEYPERGWGRRF